MLSRRITDHLCKIARSTKPITYHALAKALDLEPPNTIQQVTMGLERLIEEDATAGHPLIAALVISKGRGGLPAPGFFGCAKRVGRCHGDSLASGIADFYKIEFNAAVEFWRSHSSQKTLQNRRPQWNVLQAQPLQHAMQRNRVHFSKSHGLPSKN